ncbi:MAG: NAD-dependent epimerase/dehydratase family protein [Blastochloris sp.]|nr:NAD-dependent epimerase/dehydratase family protein [Blastochloris sp.]
MKILIAGCGYVGLALARRLLPLGHQISGWVSSPASAQTLHQAGLHAIMADLCDAASWKEHQGNYDCLVYCPSTKGGSAADYQRIYVQGLQHALSALHTRASHRVFSTSSTSVYGQEDGSWVDESSPTHPNTETGALLLEAESLVLQSGGSTLRLSAIYGPGRGVLLRRFLDGPTQLPGNPDRFLNQIHRDDAAQALLHFIEHPELPPGIYNLSDDAPATQREIYHWLAQTTSRAMPEFSGQALPSKRGQNHRRISNQKLRLTGWLPRYPSFREGYSDLLRPDSPLTTPPQPPAST